MAKISPFLSISSGLVISSFLSSSSLASSSADGEARRADSDANNAASVAKEVSGALFAVRGFFGDACCANTGKNTGMTATSTSTHALMQACFTVQTIGYSIAYSPIAVKADVYGITVYSGSCCAFDKLV